MVSEAKLFSGASAAFGGQPNHRVSPIDAGMPVLLTGVALTGDRHTGKYGPDGRLFISFRCRSPKSRAAGRPFEGDWVGWVGTYDDIAQNREGQYRVRLMDNTKGADCTYPGVEVLPDGTFVTTTYGHWQKGEQPYIVSIRLKLEELDQLAATQ